MSSTQKKGQPNESKPRDSSLLPPNTSKHDVVTRSLCDTQSVPSNSPRETTKIKTTENLMPDECGIYASNQRYLQTTTTALATGISDLSLDSGNSTLHDLGANSSRTQGMLPVTHS
jgi:hypothetical protein